MKSSRKIILRKAGFSDIEFLWYLRNQPDVYKYSRENRPVSWEKHIQWILPIILGVSNKEIFVIQSQKVPIGQIRFDYKNHKEAEISISILKEFQGRGFATKVLGLAIKKQKKVKLLTAEIHKSNLPSMKLFEKLGFKFLSKRGNWLKYNLKI